MCYIAEKVTACFKKFHSLFNDPYIWANSIHGENCQTGDEDEISPLKLKNELVRLKVWTANTGAHQKAEDSLDHRLRNASNIRDQIVRLLKDLEESLSDVKDILTGAVTPWNQEPYAMSLEDDDSDDDSFSIEEIPSSELSQIFDTTVEDINCLFRLSTAIHDPSPHDCFKMASSPTVSSLETPDVWHVARELPLASSVVVERFASAISGQRRYLRYLEIRQQDLSRRFDEKADEVAQSIEVSLVPSLVDTETVFLDSETSDAGQLQLVLELSAAYTEQATVLNIPQQGLEGPFECPFCSMIISVSSRQQWA
ncbi:hypothetical protein FGRMN_7568 [Fusarium graminum]|nr:hypothetical protein FGRMN_7568 [Fusarium graminum]